MWWYCFTKEQDCNKGIRPNKDDNLPTPNEGIYIRHKMVFRNVHDAFRDILVYAYLYIHLILFLITK